MRAAERDNDYPLRVVRTGHEGAYGHVDLFHVENLISGFRTLSFPTYDAAHAHLKHLQEQPEFVRARQIDIPVAA